MALLEFSKKDFYVAIPIFTLVLLGGVVHFMFSTTDLQTQSLRTQVEVLTERLSFLEAKVNGHLNWLPDPHAWMHNTYECKNVVHVGEAVAKKEGKKFADSHTVCFDNFRENDCIVYDFGIWKDPEFGQEMATHYGCQVHGFDPSPATIEWYPTSGLDKIPNYHYHPYGCGAIDGQLELFDYGGQVTIFQKEPTLEDKAPYLTEKKFYLPVKTLKTIMRELNHTHISILKYDVEGSEFLALQHLFDNFKHPPMDQLLIEWHHFNLDKRYSSSPDINMFVHLLNNWGFKVFFHTPQWLNEIDIHKIRFQRYQQMSLCKTCHTP